MNASFFTYAVACAATLAAWVVAMPAALAAEVAPAGELIAIAAPSPMVSTMTRDQCKAETLAARSSGALDWSGEQLHVIDAQALAGASRTREQRKADTLLAARHGQLMRAGEAS